ncbi:MAG: PCMD domain-containing protein [Bacteroidales bacterium]|nr:PCMD domain-containing protein [Bacteroidales bacterium]
MKHILTIVIFAFVMNAAFSQSNIPNGNFENWYNVVISATLNYDDIGTGPADNWLSTLNSLAAVPQTAGGPGPVTVIKTTDKYSGTFAAKAVSANFPLGPVTIFIPGMIGTAQLDFAGVRAILGKPCAGCKPMRFKGYYKFEPVNGDSCAAIILLSKWNSTAKKRDTIGYGKMVQRNAVNTYTQFDIPVNYTGSGTIDTMTLLVVSSAGFNLFNFMGGVGQPGSTMYVDELTLDYPAGIQQVLMPEVTVSAYPNPASDILHLNLSKEVKNGALEVYNAEGKQVGSYELSKRANSVPVNTLINGAYYFRLVSGKKLLNTGTFVIKK